MFHSRRIYYRGNKLWPWCITEKFPLSLLAIGSDISLRKFASPAACLIIFREAFWLGRVDTRRDDGSCDLFLMIRGISLFCLPVLEAPGLRSWPWGAFWRCLSMCYPTLHFLRKTIPGRRLCGTEPSLWLRQRRSDPKKPSGSFLNILKDGIEEIV